MRAKEHTDIILRGVDAATREVKTYGKIEKKASDSNDEYLNCFNFGWNLVVEKFENGENVL